MNHMRHKSLLAVILLALLGCRHEPPASRADPSPPKRFEKVRQPAVAGIQIETKRLEIRQDRRWNRK